LSGERQGNVSLNVLLSAIESTQCKRRYKVQLHCKLSIMRSLFVSVKCHVTER